MQLHVPCEEEVVEGIESKEECHVVTVHAKLMWTRTNSFLIKLSNPFSFRYIAAITLAAKRETQQIYESNNRPV